MTYEQKQTARKVAYTAIQNIIKACLIAKREGKDEDGIYKACEDAFDANMRFIKAVEKTLGIENVIQDDHIVNRVQHHLDFICGKRNYFFQHIKGGVLFGFN